MKVSQNIASQNSVKFVKNPQKNNEKIFNMATSGHLVYHTNIMSQMIIAKI